MIRRWRNPRWRRGRFYSVPPAAQVQAPQPPPPNRFYRRRHWRPKPRGQVYEIRLVGLAPVVVERVPDRIVRRKRLGLPRRRGQFYPIRTVSTPPVVVGMVPNRLTRRNRTVMLSRTRHGKFLRVPKKFLPLRDITVEVAFPGVSWAADGPTARTVGGRLEKGVRAVTGASVAWEVMSPTE